MSQSLDNLLQQSSARHSHLCPRQVLGVRLAVAALDRLGIESPVTKQTGLVIVETDGCFADGIEVATGATMGHRTLRVNDLGKIAATFADVATGRTIRLSPRPDAREHARLYAPDEDRHYFAQLQAYQVMPDDELLRIQAVILDPTLEALLSRPNARAICQGCGEEIINEREVLVDGITWCRTCAQGSYYTTQAATSYARQEMTQGAFGHRIQRVRKGREPIAFALTNEMPSSD
jgi:formylmethanofuran dehydrogenase subunit E